jgi:hypothetical protein
MLLCCLLCYGAMCLIRMIPAVYDVGVLAARLAIQERDWKRKRAELKRRLAVVGDLNIQARVTEQLVQSATKKLKDRLRELHSVFSVCATVLPPNFEHV